MKALIYGSGQLAQMMYLAGVPLGIEVQAVDVNQKQVVHPVSKSPLGITLEDAIEQADVLSAEFEHVPDTLLLQAHQSGKLYPSMEAISIGADRVKEKTLLDSLDIANSWYEIINQVDQLAEVAQTLGPKLILKASRDGYDGYGQWRITSPDDIPSIVSELTSLDLTQVPLIAEQFVPFERELSIVGARGINGEVSIYPLTENLHHKGQLQLSIAPALNVSEALQKQANLAFEKIANQLNYVGVLAIEFFQVGEQLLVNELAPRVHNSGHWTQQGCAYSQFENHLRAVCGLPLGNAELLHTSAMVNLIGYLPEAADVLSEPTCHLHLYGKSIRPKRKVGHINVIGNNHDDLAQNLTDLAKKLPNDHFPVLFNGIDSINKQKQG